LGSCHRRTAHFTNPLAALRFQIEKLFLDSKSGAFELTDSRLRSTDSLERLYLVAAVALLYATTQGMAVQLAGGVSKLTLETWLELSQNWSTLAQRCPAQGANLSPSPLLPKDPQPCFASYPAEGRFLFTILVLISVLCPARCDFSVSLRCVRQAGVPG